MSQLTDLLFERNRLQPSPRRSLALALASSLALTAACGDDGSATTGGGGGGASTSSSGAGPTTSASGSGSASSGTAGGTSGSGGDPGTGGAGPGAGGSGGGTGGSGGSVEAFPDDCASADDCPGGDCVEVGAGFMACRFPVEEATTCTSKEDQCCTSEDCADQGGGTCVTFPDAGYCGGPQPLEHNVCANEDTCVDCGKGGGTCLDAGFYGYNQGRCIAQQCFGDDDCGDEAGGRCAPIFNPCCGAVVGFFCAYPSDGCRDQSDCGGDQHCEGDFETGRARCVDGPAKCPA